MLKPDGTQSPLTLLLLLLLATMIPAVLMQSQQLKLGTPVSEQLQPSSPKLYCFQFDDDAKPDEEPLQAVRVEVESTDEACGLVSVQNSSCPAQNEPPSVLQTSYRQTFLSSAIIMMPRDEYRSFLVVVTAFPSNKRCLSKWKQEEQRSFDSKNFTLSVNRVQVHRGVGEAVIRLGFACLGLNIALAIVVFLIIYCGRIREAQGSSDEPEKVSSGWVLACQLIAIAIFYGLPAFQLLLRNQSEVGSGGDMDKCYYNFKCRFYAKAFGTYFLAFNSFISNIGYLSAGCAFIICVMVKQLLNRSCYPKRYSIPRCYSAYYGAGIALVMEGLLSDFYHTCPTHENYQFDTAFMFMLGGMAGLALYCKRNPSTNMLTGVVIVSGAVVVLLNTVGILLSKISEDWLSALTIVLGILFLVSCVAICCIKVPEEQRAKEIMKHCFFLLHLVIGTVYIFLGAFKTNFLLANLVLLFVLLNTALYLVFYLFNKMCRKCTGTGSLCLRVAAASILLFALSAVLGGIALSHFFQAPTDWRASPAESRARNTECQVRWFGLPFDRHDLWHLLGSHSIFCLLLLLLFMDADAETVAREELAVF